LNKLFAPTKLLTARAWRIIAEFEKAGAGLVVIDGKLIDKAVLHNTYRSNRR